MEDTRFGKPVVGQPRDPSPGESALLAAPDEYPPPASDDLVSERCQCSAVGRHGVVVEVAGNDLPQPFPLLRDRLMHAPSQLLLDLPKLRPHAVTPGFPLDEELALTRLAADEGEAEEVEGLRFAEPALGAPARRMAAELDQSGLVRMQ